ncbi:MAG: hypothetical protein WAM85_11690 [Terracidiphilus sp.]
MLRRIDRGFLLFVWIAAFCASLPAQTGKTITIRLLDGRTGRLVSSTGVLVQANHQSAVHGDWTKLNDDGTTELKVPANASVILVHATYENSTEYYINCDGPKATDTPSELWYSVSNILATGVVSADGCVKPKEADKLKVTAKPGEFVLFVRRLNWREASQD